MFTFVKEFKSVTKKTKKINTNPIKGRGNKKIQERTQVVFRTMV